jgi:hypothetical protein
VTDFARESVSTVLDEMQPLLRAHWEEIAHWPDIEFKPALERYQQLEAVNYLRIYTVRDQGVLVGYAIYVVATGLHSCQTLQAEEDCFYISPAARSRQLWMGLLNLAESSLKAEGVVIILQHQKHRIPVMGEILKRLSYECIDQVWAKRLN